MFSLKKANVLYKFTNILNRLPIKLCTRNFTATMDNQTNMENFADTAQSQIPQQKNIMSLFPYMKAEMQKQPEYMQVFPDLVRELTDFSKFMLIPNNFKEAEDHFIKMLDYNLSDGRRDQLLVLTRMYRDLMVNKEITTENIKQSHLLGWCMEMYVNATAINDDILDKGEIRRNKTCWHKVKGMDRAAITDMLLLENGCLIIMKRFFSHLPCYNGIMQTVTEIFMIVMMGCQYELQLKTKVDYIEHFRVECFNYMNVMKAGYHRFYMPAAMAMLLAGYDLIKDQKSFEALKLISIKIGPYYQAQNDYLDCFADQSFLNKPENDIQNGQYTWFASMAMELGTEQQKDTMRTNYGKNDAVCVAKVKQLYKELHLPELYHEYKERNRNNVMDQIDQLLHSDETLRNACINLFSQGYETPKIV